MTATLLGISATLGLVVGSFLNVVVHRVPTGMSVARPRSACPACQHEIAARDSVPVLSWLALRGRCRHCSAAISLRYPAVEVGTAALFAAVAVRFGLSWTLPAVAVFVAGLVALACIDLEHYLLPARVVYATAAGSGALLLAGAAVTGEWGRLGVAVSCAAGTFAVFFALNWANPRWLGFGDVRLAGLIGLVLGWLGPVCVILGMLAANVVGLAVAAALILTGRMGRHDRIPYGVFLAAGSLLAVLAGGPLVHLIFDPYWTRHR